MPDDRNAKKNSYQRAYYRAHPEKFKVYGQRRYRAHRETILERQRLYNATHREQINAQHRQYDKEHSGAKQARTRAYRESHRDRVRERQRKYRETHRAEISASGVRRREVHHERVIVLARLARQRFYWKHKNDMARQIPRLLRMRLCDAVRGNAKSGSAVRDLGCSIAAFKEHIAGLFKPGMSWDNHGGWHLDHIARDCSARFVLSPASAFSQLSET